MSMSMHVRVSGRSVLQTAGIPRTRLSENELFALTNTSIVHVAFQQPSRLRRAASRASPITRHGLATRDLPVGVEDLLLAFDADAEFVAFAPAAAPAPAPGAPLASSPKILLRASSYSFSRSASVLRCTAWSEGGVDVPECAPPPLRDLFGSRRRICGAEPCADVEGGRIDVGRVRPDEGERICGIGDGEGEGLEWCLRRRRGCDAKFRSVRQVSQTGRS